MAAESQGTSGFNVGCLALMVLIGGLLMLIGLRLARGDADGAATAPPAATEAGLSGGNEGAASDAAPASAGVDPTGLTAVTPAAVNVVQDGGGVWSCPEGCTLLPACADGAPLKAYTVADATGSAARVYYTSAAPGYGDMGVNPGAGDRWFCTEDEAVRAGYVRGW